MGGGLGDKPRWVNIFWITKGSLREEMILRSPPQYSHSGHIYGKDSGKKFCPQMITHKLSFRILYYGFFPRFYLSSCKTRNHSLSHLRMGGEYTRVSHKMHPRLWDKSTQFFYKLKKLAQKFEIFLFKCVID